MAQYWATVAAHFKDSPYVIGYDIINEPPPGNVWEHIGYAIDTAKFEREHLQPFYQNMMRVIYEQDPNHIIFFEPVVSSIMPAGFDKGGPGAALGIPAEKQGYSWHLYCLTIDENGDPVQPKVLCDAQDTFWYDQRNASGTNLGVTQVITEFGALPDDEPSRELLAKQLELMSADGHSWLYWQYKTFSDITTVFGEVGDHNEGFFNKDGSVQTEKVKLLSHPYPAVVAGVSNNHKFDFDKKTLDFKFTTGKVGEVSVIPISTFWTGFG